ncbi:nucleoside diphosphate-linked moiety X motif 8-like isoform X2 [Patiria miniata]|uniref:Nudix hydrolase domain-containing protein n=1 Tax=Patiria miniata TaxID=46514 RepID=A0A914BNN0_PATMI|nr:nucleoside diphosphate-linked moiety X motif 8-like isoform X2 [Patiria miniata]
MNKTQEYWVKLAPLVGDISTMSLFVKLPIRHSKSLSVSSCQLQQSHQGLASMVLRCSRHFVSVATTSYFARSMRKNKICKYTAPRTFSVCKIRNGSQSKSLQNSKIGFVDSGQSTSSLESMVFSQDNKARAIKQMSIMKPSTTSFFFKRRPIRSAGVCVPLCRIDRIPSILYTLRSQFVSSHSGEISFPGGVMDEKDTDVTQTSLRELKEEVGICPESVEMWGQLVPVPDRSGKTSATATLAYIGDIDLTKLGYDTKEEIGPYVLPVFRGAGYHIWGLTAVLTDLALGVLAPDHYKSLYF